MRIILIAMVIVLAGLVYAEPKYDADYLASLEQELTTRYYTQAVPARGVWYKQSKKKINEGDLSKRALKKLGCTVKVRTPLDGYDCSLVVHIRGAGAYPLCCPVQE